MSQVEVLRQLDFPTPDPEFRPLHSGLLVPSTDQETIPMTPVRAAPTAERVVDAPAAVSPVPALTTPTPARAPATTSPAPVEPVAPVPPEYWGRRGLSIVYWIAILGGAAGQIAFFGALFDVGAWGYVAAAIIATTCETIMVSSGDTALDFRARGRSGGQWKPFAWIAFLAAATASGLNLAHWLADLPELGVLFGLIAFIGFVLHYMDGYIAGTDHLAHVADYEQLVAEIEAERRRIAKETEQDRRLAQRAAAAAIEPAAPPTAKPTKTKKTSSRKSGKASKGRAPKAVALEVARAAGAATPAPIRQALVDAGYTPPGQTALEGYARELKTPA